MGGERRVRRRRLGAGFTLSHPALDSFSSFDETALCAFLNEAERALAQGVGESTGLRAWRLTRYPDRVVVEMLWMGGITRGEAPNIRAAVKVISDKLLSEGLRSAPIT
jgi:hypothetical protein